MTINLDFERMKEICLAPIESFKQIKGAEVIETVHGPLIYINRGAKVLGVAHLDSTSVADGSDHFYHLPDLGKRELVLNAQLDDRLGAYVLLDLLPRLGIVTDILLTYGEETGNSTGQFFKTDKRYNWMYQFDRAGDDVVHYQYGGDGWTETLRKYFKKPTHGAFSDICYMEHVGCKGFNLGTAYEDNHSIWAMADMDVLRDQVERFVEFYKKHRRHYFKHEKKTWKGKANTGYHGYGMPHRTQQYNYMEDYYADDNWRMSGQIVTGKKCDVCHQLTVFADSNFPNVCKGCEEKLKPCIGCGKHFYGSATKADPFVCEGCKKKGNKFITVTKCSEPTCNLRLFMYEIIDNKGLCNHHKKFPELMGGGRRI